MPEKKPFYAVGQSFREFLGELFGTYILLVFGAGVCASVSLNGDGSFFSINIGYALGILFGVLVSNSSSGSHLNPAVTLTMIIHGKMHWSKFFHYALG